MFGFACRETPELMPLPIALAHRMARRLAEVRKDGTLPTTCARTARPRSPSSTAVASRVAVRTVVVAAQHDDDVATERLRDDIIEIGHQAVIVPAELRADDAQRSTSTRPVAS